MYGSLLFFAPSHPCDIRSVVGICKSIFFFTEMFVEVRVFFNRLTNEESRKNWEEHGNPDGPGGI